MTARAGLRRRSMLAVAVAAPAAVACRTRRDETTPDHRPREPAILDLSFSIQSGYRPFELVAERFVSTDGPVGTASAVLLGTDSPPAPFAAVEVVPGAGGGVALAGLATPDGDHVMAFLDRAGGQAGIEVRVDGQTHVVADAPLPEGVEVGRFAFVVCENKVTVLVHGGGDWRPVLTEREEVAARVDLRVPATLSEYVYAWGARPDSGEVALDRVRAGLFGMVGLRDQHLVQHADGTPYVREGRLFFTATCAGPGFFQQAHWGVFALDPEDPVELEQVAQLYFRRDGLLLGDHAGQVVRDDESDRWIVATSSWGDFDHAGVHVRHVLTPDDVLSGVHVLETEPTSLPTRVSAWDPGMVRIEGRWFVSFVESPSQQPFDFHPALAVTSPGARWDEDLRLVGAADDLHQCEGPILARVQDDWWLLASDGDAREYPVFDLQMKRVGRLDAPYRTNIPHPQLVPAPTGELLLVTFDGTQYAKDVLGYGTHGDVLVMRAEQERDDSPAG